MFEPDRLGEALRRLRASRNLKQRQVALGAEITPSMLSGYENGRKQPTIATLEKILTAMDCGLGDLARALRSVPEKEGSAREDTAPEGTAATALLRCRGSSVLGAERTLPSLAPELREIFECDEPLSREEEQAFGEMLRGYCRWLKLLRSARRARL